MLIVFCLFAYLFHPCCCLVIPIQLLGNDTTQQFDNLKVNLSDVNVLSNDTSTSLKDLSNSGVDEIDFDAFLNEVKFFRLVFNIIVTLR